MLMRSMLLFYKMHMRRYRISISVSSSSSPSFFYFFMAYTSLYIAKILFTYINVFIHSFIHYISSVSNLLDRRKKTWCIFFHFSHVGSRLSCFFFFVSLLLIFFFLFSFRNSFCCCM